jgi:hypothetical protein
MIESFFIASVIIFIVCFVIGVIVSMIYGDNVEKYFKSYDVLINIMTWSIFTTIPTGLFVLVKKFFIDFLS